jgi:hypothetical protein
MLINICQTLNLDGRHGEYDPPLGDQLGEPLVTEKANIRS